MDSKLTDYLSKKQICVRMCYCNRIWFMVDVCKLCSTVGYWCKLRTGAEDDRTKH